MACPYKNQYDRKPMNYQRTSRFITNSVLGSLAIMSLIACGSTVVVQDNGPPPVGITNDMSQSSIAGTKWSEGSALRTRQGRGPWTH
jgi:hypothetical protein